MIIPPVDAAYDLLRAAVDVGLEKALNDKRNIEPIWDYSDLAKAIRKHHRFGHRNLDEVKKELDRALTDKSVVGLIQRGGTERYPLTSMQELAGYADKVLR